MYLRCLLIHVKLTIFVVDFVFVLGLVSFVSLLFVGCVFLLVAYFGLGLVVFFLCCVVCFFCFIRVSSKNSLSEALTVYSDIYR